MAGIDKTYVSSSKDYFDFIEWAKEKKFTCPNGIILNPLDYVYEQDPETIDERIKEYGRITLMNTPVSMDYFLIKYCPLTFVQDRLREVYPESFIEDINKGISCFDNYRRDIGTKVKCIQESYYGPKDFLDKPRRTRGIDYWIQIYNPDHHLNYNDSYDIWVDEGRELGRGGSNVCHKKIKTKKALIRQIRKWKLPKGTIIRWIGSYVDDTMEFKVY